LIALTGYGQAADRQQTLEAGFVRHLLKPATIDQVQEAIAGVQVPAF
jgi:CheY-like chemotaxis protein